MSQDRKQTKATTQTNSGYPDLLPFSVAALGARRAPDDGDQSAQIAGYRLVMRIGAAFSAMGQAAGQARSLLRHTHSTGTTANAAGFRK